VEEEMTKTRRTALLDLSGPVGCLADSYYNWAVSVAGDPNLVSPPAVITATGTLLPFIEAVLYEIFKEHYLSNLIEDEPESNKVLRLWGMPPELISSIKHDFLNTVIATIYTYHPDIYFAEMQEWDYGMCENNMLMIKIYEDVETAEGWRSYPSPSFVYD
jgi:hypothetical protein